MYPVHANGENDNSYARGAYRLFERGGHYRQPRGFVAGEIRDYVPILRDFTDVLASFVVCRAVRFRSFFGTGVDGMFKICNPLCLHLTPPSLRATSPIFLRCKNTEEEGKYNPFHSLKFGSIPTKFLLSSNNRTLYPINKKIVSAY